MAGEPASLPEKRRIALFYDPGRGIANRGAYFEQSRMSFSIYYMLEVKEGHMGKSEGITDGKRCTFIICPMMRISPVHIMHVQHHLQFARFQWEQRQQDTPLEMI